MAADSRLERLGVGLALALVAAPAVFWHGGVVEEEALGFLGNYWGARPVLQRIFDPRGYDFYQGRELSYAVDFLDAQWLRQLLSHDVFFFVPPSLLLASLGFVAVGLFLVPRALPALPRAAAWPPILLYLSGFAALSTSGLLYRATKPLVAPLLLGLLLFALAEVRAPRAGTRRAFLVAFSTGLAMSLLDRQGVFYLSLAAAALTAVWALRRRGLPLLLGVVAAGGSWALYNYEAGPVLVHALNGYWPRMRFQRLRLETLLGPQPWREASALLGDWTSVLFGGLPIGLLLVAAAAVVILLLRRRGRGVRALALGSLALLAGAHLTMLAILVVHHEPITWIDHRFWYYPLPFHAFLVFALLLLLEALGRRGTRALRLAVLVMVALAVLNVLRWPERRQAMESGPWFGDVSRRSAELGRALRTGVAPPLLDGDYRRFYFQCLDRFPNLAARSGPHVREGAGVGVTEMRDGRLYAAAEAEARLTAFAPVAGTHVLEGGLRLGPGETVSVLLASSPPRLLGEVVQGAAAAGPEFFRVRLALSAGKTDLLLLSNRPSGFGLLLPMSLLWQGPLSEEEGPLVPEGPGAPRGHDGGASLLDQNSAASLSRKKPTSVTRPMA